MDPILAIFLMIASAIITASMVPSPEQLKPEAFSDIDFPQADEGTPQAVIFGDCWSEDWMVLAVGNYRTTEIRKDAGAKK
jgi:hypothetical protein